MSALPSVSNCCPPDCADPVIVNIPGPKGDDGADGTNGVGIDAFTTTTASFVMPAEGATVSVAMVQSAFIAVGQNVYVATAGMFQCTAKADGTHATLKNIKNTASGLYTDNVAPTTVISSGVQVSIGGLQGSVAASGPAGGDLKGTYPNPKIGIGNTKGNLIVGNGTDADVLSAGTNGKVPAYDSASALGLIPTTIAPNTATDNAIARFDGATGKPVPVQNSTVIVTDLGSVQTTGGNARGSEAVDLQATRTSNSRVASGAQAVIGGGKENTASGLQSNVGGGTTNAATGAQSTVAGGSSNSAAGAQATVGGGGGNSASGDTATVAGGQTNAASQVTASTIGGGAQNLISGPYSYATISGGKANLATGESSIIPGGQYAVADKFGQVAHANGRFSDAGDAQTSELLWRIATADATPTELLLDGTRATVPNNTSWIFMILLVARRDTGTVSIYKSEGRISNNAGTTTVAGVTTTEINDGIGLPPTPVTVDADDTNDTLRITCTGVAANNIRWVAHARIVEVAY